MIKYSGGTCKDPGVVPAFHGFGAEFSDPRVVQPRVRTPKAVTFVFFFTKRHDYMLIMTENVASFLASLFHTVGLTSVPRYSCGPTVYDHAHLGHAW